MSQKPLDLIESDIFRRADSEATTVDEADHTQHISTMLQSLRGLLTLRSDIPEVMQRHGLVSRHLSDIHLTGSSLSACTGIARAVRSQKPANRDFLLQT